MAKDTRDDNPDGARAGSGEVAGGAGVVTGVQHVRVANDEQTVVSSSDATLTCYRLTVRSVPSTAITPIIAD